VYAVFRENTYPNDIEINRHPNFREFQQTHGEQPGYLGTVVSHIGDGRYLSITLWATEADMKAARETLGPVVGSLIDPLMVSPSKLLGTGRVVVNDIIKS
jgi:hypothetical protein